MHSIVSAHTVPWSEVHMRGRYKAILSSAPSVRLCTLKGGMPSTPTVQAGVVYVGCIAGASACRASWPPTPMGHSSVQRAVCIVTCGPISDTMIKEVRRNLPLLSIVVKVGSNAKGYPSSSQTLFDSFFLLFQLSFGQVKVPLLLLIAHPLPS